MSEDYGFLTPERNRSQQLPNTPGTVDRRGEPPYIGSRRVYPKNPGTWYYNEKRGYNEGVDHDFSGNSSAHTDDQSSSSVLPTEHLSSQGGSKRFRKKSRRKSRKSRKRTRKRTRRKSRKSRKSRKKTRRKSRKSRKSKKSGGRKRSRRKSRKSKKSSKRRSSKSRKSHYKLPSVPKGTKFQKGPGRYKYTAILPDGKRVNFGHRDYQHFRDRVPKNKGGKLWSHKDHNDRDRMENYRSRHRGVSTKSGTPAYKKKYSPSWFSYHYLW